MAPVTKSSFWGPRSRLRQVSQNPSHYRSGRWFLLVEGLVVAALGVAGLVVAGSRDAQPVGVGAPLLGLTLAPAHCALLLGFGVLAVVATVRRQLTVAVAGFGAVGYLLLFAIGTPAAAGHHPGPLGLDLRDSVLHAVLLAVNLALSIWLLPDALEDPAWVPRRQQPETPTTDDKSADDDRAEPRGQA